MKSLCISGASADSCEFAGRIIYGSGLTPAKPLQHGRMIDMRTWHQRAGPLLLSGEPLGRLWERTAEELLLVNLSDGAWGWCEAESVWALDYWANLDPSIHFLLLCEPPEKVLAAALLQGEAAPDFHWQLEDWRARHSRMLEFYLTHPERCLLVDAWEAQTCPVALVECINERWQLLPTASSATEIEQSTATNSPAFELCKTMVATVLSKELATLEELRQEIEAAQLPLSDTTAGRLERHQIELPVSTLGFFKQLLDDRVQVHAERQARVQAELELDKVKADLNDSAIVIDNLVAEKGELAEQLYCAQQELDAQNQKAAQIKKEIDDLLREKAALSTTLTEQLGLQKECEQLLVSLHEAQERLEQSSTQREQESASFAREREELQAAVKLAQQEANSEVEALRHKQRHSERETERLQQECERLVTSLYEAQERLEQSIVQRDQDNTTFVRERDTLQTELEQTRYKANSEVEELRQKQRLSERETERLQQECETLLLKLHQTQDSLEKSTQESQRRDHSLQELRQRLHNLKGKAGPAYAADWAVAALPQANRLEMQFEQLLLDGVEHDRLNANMEHDDKRVNLLVETVEGQRWTIDSNRLPSINSLPLSWRQSATDLLPLLHCSLPREGLSHREIKQWERAFTSLREVLSERTPQLVFESAELRNSQINPDYEHLWIRLRKAQFANSSPNDWHFRISCANVSPHAFGREPKLEVPQQELQLLKGWFEEGRDDFGAKLELRFAIPDAMDLGVWIRLPRQDQHLIQSLVLQLPAIIESLEQKPTSFGRPAEDWKQLAESMRRILQAQAT
ncbi:hypothetical protein [Aquibaculum arenosum]|uniref:Uncharacterized protein n=1 Tax=Aquibaculum arenosum TaxID=3032591 RepID=A0ABT5YMT0_9PROT|nr:hypothetical protein [Fodinicurvata sp. CAU 1616]MDF2096153.1 hypothetical protein [Fodinicurvata sp. CAU 1616]